ncbi:hypothetical protein VNO77_27709 [Canavalia gladiata]|uniref:Uncharacterized protein n=1 Tax=Canavalia gladiata TaxID=3824 RepID=A0AAN9QAR6_CANGL
MIRFPFRLPRCKEAIGDASRVAAPSIPPNKSQNCPDSGSFLYGLDCEFGLIKSSTLSTCSWSSALAERPYQGKLPCLECSVSDPESLHGR